MRKYGIEEPTRLDPVQITPTGTRRAVIKVTGDGVRPVGRPRQTGTVSDDQAEARNEMARQFAVCYRCQHCVGVCDVFPFAFDQIADLDDGDPGNSTPFQQDAVVDRCTFCAICTDVCTHAEPPDSVDVMALMLRMQAMRLSVGEGSRSRTGARLTTRLPGALGRAALSRSCLSGDGCHARDGSALGCCGAGELFSGNVAGFQRLNVRLRDLVGKRTVGGASAESDIEVSDPRCARLIGQTLS